MTIVDYSNEADVIAAIKIYKDRCEYRFNAQDEAMISDFLFKKIGEELKTSDGVPLFMEASSWCALADVGQTFEEDDFEICILNTTN